MDTNELGRYPEMLLGRMGELARLIEIDRLETETRIARISMCEGCGPMIREEWLHHKMRVRDMQMERKYIIRKLAEVQSIGPIVFIMEGEKNDQRT